MGLKIAHIQYFKKILTWLRGFLWSFFYIWFGFLGAQVSSGSCETMESRKVAILSLKPRCHDVRILIDGFFPLDFTNFKIF